MDANKTTNEPMMPARKPRKPRAKKVVVPPPAPVPAYICCLCQDSYTGYGNNPEPAYEVTEADERCCNDCNFSRVIPLRFALVADATKAAKLVPKELTEAEVLATYPDAENVLHAIREQVDFAGDDVLQLLLCSHRHDLAFYLHSPESTELHRQHDEEADTVLSPGTVVGSEHLTWGYTYTKRHACVAIWCRDNTAYDCWRVFMHKVTGHGGELHDATDSDESQYRVWND